MDRRLEAVIQLFYFASVAIAPMRTRAFRIISRRLTIIVGIPVRLELQQSFLQFHTPHLFRVQVRGKPMTLWLRRSTKDAFRLFVSGGNQVLTGQHRMRLTPDPDRGTNTKITFAIVLDHSSKVINGRQPIGLLNDMVRESNAS